MKKEIKSSLTKTEIVARLRQNIDFGYSNKIGSIALSKGYYGDKLAKNYYKIWKAPVLKLGILDWKFTEAFFIKVQNEKLEIEIKNNLIFKIVVFVGMVFFILSFGMNDQFKIPIEYIIGFITVIPILHLLFLRLTRKAVLADFKRFVNNL